MARDTSLNKGALCSYKLDNKFEMREELIKAKTAGGQLQAYLM